MSNEDDDYSSLGCLVHICSNCIMVIVMVVVRIMAYIVLVDGAWYRRISPTMGN